MLVRVNIVHVLILDIACRYIVTAGAMAALSTTLMGSLLPQVFPRLVLSCILVPFLCNAAQA